MVHSRFTTTEIRCIRLYISETNPSFELTRITKYLVYVWGEVFITSKHRNSLEHGSRLLLLEVMLTRKHCTFPEKTVLKTVMNTNGQYGHPENVLISLLSSPVAEEREIAVETIFNIREQGPKVWQTPTGQRPFKVK